MGEAYHLKPGAIDQETMAFEHEVDKLRETLKSTEQRRATAEHDRGVWQRKAELAQASIKTQHAEIEDLTEKMEMAKKCWGAETVSRVYWEERATSAESGCRDLNKEIEDLTEKLKAAGLVGIDAHPLRDMTAMHDHWKNRAEGAEAGLRDMKVWREGLMAKLVDRVQTILRTEPDSEFRRGEHAVSASIVQAVGLTIRPKIVAPVMVTWSAPDTTNT
jgi:predicted  nucleic acid-binding Zn-ribbon protein